MSAPFLRDLGSLHSLLARQRSTSDYFGNRLLRRLRPLRAAAQAIEMNLMTSSLFQTITRWHQDCVLLAFMVVC